MAVTLAQLELWIGTSLRIHFALSRVNMFLSMHTGRNGKEQHVFQALLQAIPSLECRLLTSSDEEVLLVADLVCPHLRFRIPAQSRRVIGPTTDPEGHLRCQIG